MMISEWGWDGERGRGGGQEGGRGGKERGVSFLLVFNRTVRCSSLSTTFPQCAVSSFDHFPYYVQFVQRVNLCHDHATRLQVPADSFG